MAKSVLGNKISNNMADFSVPTIMKPMKFKDDWESTTKKMKNKEKHTKKKEKKMKNALKKHKIKAHKKKEKKLEQKKLLKEKRTKGVEKDKAAFA
jgi:hypothetical protein